jgi:hypothetical protein
MANVNPQTDCLPLSLPPEMRNEIYKLVLTVPANGQGTVEITNKPEHPEKATVLSLLQTCRTINDEAKGLFYHLNPVHLRQHGKAKGGLAIARHTSLFLRTLSPGRLHCIREITVTSNWLWSFTTALKRMKPLNGLRVVTLQIEDAMIFFTLNRDKFESGMPDLLRAARGLPASVTEVKVRILGGGSWLDLFRGKRNISRLTLERRLNSALAERLLGNVEEVI